MKQAIFDAFEIRIGDPGKVVAPKAFGELPENLYVDIRESPVLSQVNSDK